LVFLSLLHGFPPFFDLAIQEPSPAALLPGSTPPPEAAPDQRFPNMRVHSSPKLTLSSKHLPIKYPIRIKIARKIIFQKPKNMISTWRNFGWYLMLWEDRDSHDLF
jgi:hypothetical protein